MKIADQNSDIFYYKFPNLEVPHGIFPRKDLVGKHLNVSLSLEAYKSEQVLANHNRIKNALGLVSLVHVEQVHGNKVLYIENAQMIGSDEQADGLITDKKGIGLMVKVADCEPVLFYSPEKQVIGMAHCGWRGAVNGILENMVKSFRKMFNVPAHDLLVAIGPSLGPCCAEFSDPHHELPKSFHPYILKGRYVDLWTASRSILKKMGIAEKHIEIAKICTACNNHVWFSYRKDHLPKDMGRFGVVIGLN